MKNIAIIGLLTITFYQCFGMDQKQQEAISTETSGSTSSVSSSNAQNVPGATTSIASTAAETTSAAGQLEEEIKMKSELLAKRIEKLSSSIALLGTRAPIEDLEEGADYKNIFDWLIRHRGKLSSDRANELAVYTLFDLENLYLPLHQEVEKLETEANERLEKNEQDPELETLTLKLEQKSKDLVALKQALKKQIDEIVALEKEAYEALTAKKKREPLSLKALEAAKRNLEASKTKLLKAPSPSPRISRSPSISSSPSPSTTSRISTPRLSTSPEHRFFYAVQKGNVKEVIDALDNKMNPNVREDLNNRTPLHVAAINGQTAVTYVLIEHGADVNAKDSHQDTPLLYAIKYYQPETAIMLIYHGNANVNYGNGRHMPLDHVLRIIEKLEKENTSKDVMNVWQYLLNLIRDRGGMTRNELAQQIIIAQSQSYSPSSSSSPTPVMKTASSSSVLTPISPEAITSQSEAISVTAQLPGAIVSRNPQETHLYFAPATHREPSLEFPLFGNLQTQATPQEEYKIPDPQRIQSQLAALSMQDIAESKNEEKES